MKEVVESGTSTSPNATKTVAQLKQEMIPTAPTSGPVVGFKPTPVRTVDTSAPVQGPMTGTNLGKDAAAAMSSGTPLSAAQTTAAQDYNVSQGLNPDGTKKPTGYDKDAYATLMGFLNKWGLASLSDTIIKSLSAGNTYDETLTKIKYDNSPIDHNNPKGPKWNDAYTARFAGNAARIAQGLNAYDEGTYLDVENSYEETLRQYGINNLISTDAKKNQAKWAEYMANDIAPTEFAERIKTVADRVINMDPSIKAQFIEYYPSLTNNDLVSYFLDPKQTLPVLKNKVSAAEIGAVAAAADKDKAYSLTEARAMELAKFGVTRDQALREYQNIAEVVPTATKLSGIYNEEGIQYGKTQAEDEFLKQDAQAKLKRNRLASKERAMYAGQTGVGATSFDRAPMF